MRQVRRINQIHHKGVPTRFLDDLALCSTKSFLEQLELGIAEVIEPPVSLTDYRCISIEDTFLNEQVLNTAIEHRVSPEIIVYSGLIHRVKENHLLLAVETAVEAERQ